MLIVALPVSYALARFRSRLRPVTNGWILVSQVFPVILIVIPLFMILRPLHLTNTIPGVVIVYMVWSLPFALWMLQGYVAAVPRELEEAASVDGASRVRTIVSIVMPLLRPGADRDRDVHVHLGVERVLLRPGPAPGPGDSRRCRWSSPASSVPRARSSSVRSPPASVLATVPSLVVLRLPAAPADVRPVERRSQGLSPIPLRTINT